MDSATEEGVTFFHRCSACGKCCNSPPAMTLPELFHHEARFFGCLALRRFPIVRPGTLIAHGTGERRADAEDALEAEHLAELVMHPLPNRAASLRIAGQAFGYASQGRCPALDAEGRCSVHHDRKPLTCGVVPLDASLPDRLQSAVLSSRARELERLGADCLRTSPEPDFSPLTRGPRLLAPETSAQLEAQRAALAEEKRLWGSRTFAALSRERSFNLDTVPDNGHFELSLAPALLVLAEVSGPMRERCIAYLDAQALLGETMIQRAIERRSLVDRPATERLRTFVKTNATLRRALRAAPSSAWTHDGAEALEIEQRFGVPSERRVLPGG